MSDPIKDMIEKYTKMKKSDPEKHKADVNALNDFLVKNMPDTGERIKVLTTIIFAHLYIHLNDQVVNSTHYENIIDLYTELMLKPLISEKFHNLVALNRLYKELKTEYPDIQFSELFSPKIFAKIINGGGNK